jgi:hypothetical protein
VDLDGDDDVDNEWTAWWLTWGFFIRRSTRITHRPETRQARTDPDYRNQISISYLIVFEGQWNVTVYSQVELSRQNVKRAVVNINVNN